MGKTKRKGCSKKKRGGFAALQHFMNKAHAGLTDATREMKKKADEAHRTTLDMINKAHAQGTVALHQAKGAANTGLSHLQTQAAKAQGALATGAHRVEQQAGQVTKQVGGRRRKHKTRRRARHRVHRRKRKTRRRRRRR